MVYDSLSVEKILKKCGYLSHKINTSDLSLKKKKNKKKKGFSHLEMINTSTKYYTIKYLMKAVSLTFIFEVDQDLLSSFTVIKKQPHFLFITDSLIVCYFCLLE